jgi:hypothetical protein
MRAPKTPVSSCIDLIAALYLRPAMSLRERTRPELGIIGPRLPPFNLRAWLQ